MAGATLTNEERELQELEAYLGQPHDEQVAFECGRFGKNRDYSTSPRLLAVYQRGQVAGRTAREKEKAARLYRSRTQGYEPRH